MFTVLTKKANILGIGCLAALLGLFLMFDSNTNIACAAAAPPPIAATPCDATYYQSLEARAWLEAQREITQNQNLIFKPDSVLEYTCFGRFANELADGWTSGGVQGMFSETTRWGVILPPTSMDTALDNLVGVALTNYITANFESRAPSVPGPPPPIVSQPAANRYDLLGGRNVGIDYEPPFSVAGGTYTCDIMARIWAEAKCMNFISEPVSDGFYTFEHYATNDDKRILPTRCAKDSRWSNMQTTAITSPPWVADTVQTYLGYIDPANCGSGAYPAIATGVQIQRPKNTPPLYNEKVCVVPGCHYVPSGVNTGTCTPNP